MIDLKDYLAPGYSHEYKLTVTSEEAVGNFSPKLDQLLATSACVKAFIRAAIEATDQYLPEGYITVGQSIEISHEVPSYIGTTVNFKATLRDIDRNKI
nr:thioesterase [Synergistales bacterium]